MGAPLEMATGSPHPGIAGYVRRYTGWREIAPGAVRRCETPSADIPLILNLGDPFTVRSTDRPGVPAERFGSFVAGVHDRVVETAHPGVSHGVQVDLTPLGARMLLGCGMSDLARRTVALSDVLGRDADRLVERIDDAPVWGARFAIIDAFIASRIARARPPAGDVAWAWRRLDLSRGRVGVGELTAEIGCSRRHLAARFRDEVGVGPKLVGRILRFEAALAALRAPEGPGLGEIAAGCGYYDQAHLNRDVRAFSGLTPAQVRAGRPVTFVQDPVGAPA